MRVVVIADETDREGGYVTERLRQHGAAVEFVDRGDLPARSDYVAEGPEVDLLLLLGSSRSAHDPRHVHAVMAESDWVWESLAAGTPVMGICFGAQLMARALGGHSYRMAEPEVGWVRVDSTDHVLCPPGPWGQFHQDTFVPPQHARVLGSTWYGPQCFIEETHGAKAIAWQFHPEVVPEVYARWVDEDASTVRAAEADGDGLKREAQRLAPQARTRAFALTDAALDYLGVEAVEGGGGGASAR
ncbi:type 1 glutamine amidotransferase [Aeromicrobium sp. Leaf350]|uniref:type 1 glutamine amidotransferase n=1 Tax=Aeromicrobium sp. Leaf350 TaxID=2876565 RepID=UPI001E4CC2B7|nr:gamma-glutamyl-gamma-aminobutyrate hydrolase family protein [Aeromicrobium sp. Leaf350]